jgi:hypothetical protein
MKNFEPGTRNPKNRSLKKKNGSFPTTLNFNLSPLCPMCLCGSPKTLNFKPETLNFI